MTLSSLQGESQVNVFHLLVERRREEKGGEEGGMREREKGRELTLPNPSPFFPSPKFDTFPSLHIRF